MTQHIKTIEQQKNNPNIKRTHNTYNNPTTKTKQQPNNVRDVFRVVINVGHSTSLKHNVPGCHVFVERQRDKVVVGDLPLALHEPEAKNGDQRNPVQCPVGDVPTVVLPGNVHLKISKIEKMLVLIILVIVFKHKIKLKKYMFV